MLLADCGNSAIKLIPKARVDEPQALRRSPPEELSAILAAEPKEPILCLPGSADQTHILKTAAGPRAVINCPVPDCGQYPGCGADRVMAAIAAIATHPSGVIVIDTGTAWTLSAWRQGPHFAGGLIIPGPQACLNGLHASAPALPQLQMTPGPGTAAQHETQAAMIHAQRIGHHAMLAACLEALRTDTGIDSILVTGGLGADLAKKLKKPYRPLLVLQGMAIAYARIPQRDPG